MNTAVDEQATTNLSKEILQIIGLHFLSRTRDRAAVYEILNALACVSAEILKATADPQARAFFKHAILQQLMGIDLPPYVNDDDGNHF
jgi:hypothetical protein